MDYFNKPLAERMDDNKNENEEPKEESKENSEGMFDSLSKSFNNTVDDLKSKDASTSASEFVNSNTIVTKFVFLILVLV